MIKKFITFGVLFSILCTASFFAIPTVFAKPHVIDFDTSPVDQSEAITLKAYITNDALTIDVFTLNGDRLTEDNIKLIRDHIDYERGYCTRYHNDKYIQCMIEELNEHKIYPRD